MANPLNVLVKDKLYNCPLCNFSSELLNKLAHHRKYCKGYLLKYTCPVCPKTSVKKISNWELALLHSAKCIPQDDLKIMCLFCCKSVHAEKYPMHIHSEILSIDFIKKLLTLAKKNGIDNLNCCYCNCMLPNSYIKSIHEQLHRKIVKRQAEVLADSKIPKGPRKRRALKLVKDNWEPGNGIRIPRNHLSYRLKQPPKNLKEMTRALVGETKFFCPHCPNHYKTSQETQNHVRERHPKVGLPVRFSVGKNRFKYNKCHNKCHFLTIH